MDNLTATGNASSAAPLASSAAPSDPHGSERVPFTLRQLTAAELARAERPLALPTFKVPSLVLVMAQTDLMRGGAQFSLACVAAEDSADLADRMVAWHARERIHRWAHIRVTPDAHGASFHEYAVEPSPHFGA